MLLFDICIFLKLVEYLCALFLYLKNLKEINLENEMRSTKSEHL